MKVQNYLALLGTALLVGETQAAENKTAPAHVEAPTPVTKKEITTPAPQDGQASLQNDVDFLHQKFEKLSIDKGYDETVGLFLGQVAPLFEHVRVLVGRTHLAKDAVRQTQDHIAALQTQLQKEQDVVKGLETQTAAVVDHIKTTLGKVEAMPVAAPAHFPERCGLMVTDEAVQGDGLEAFSGIVEKFNKKWVLTFADASASDGAKRLPLDERVGLTGSKDHSASIHVMSFTPAGMFVTGLFDPKTQTVVCVSQTQKVLSPAPQTPATPPTQPIQETVVVKDVPAPAPVDAAPVPAPTPPVKEKKKKKSPAHQAAKSVDKSATPPQATAPTQVAAPVQAAAPTQTATASQGMQEGFFEDEAPAVSTQTPAPAPVQAAPKGLSVKVK